MAPSDRPPERPLQPQGVENEGQEAYPTYHDSPASARGAKTTKPTDSDLPQSKRSYASPMLIGLAAFALVIVVLLVWGSINMAGTADEAMSPGGADNPPAAMTSAPDANAPAPAVPPGEEQPQTTSGPGEVEAAPGAVDVPGGEVTEPAAEPPAQ